MAQSTHVPGSHRRSRDHDSGTIRCTNTEWEAKEALYQRELDEARARATQMEKTMRWWSDCTANWREKWSKVRSERNKAREEAKQYKTKIDALTKELNTVRIEKKELENQLSQLKNPNDKLLNVRETNEVSDVEDDTIELRRKGFNSPQEPPSVRQRASLDSHKFNKVDNALANKLGEMRLKLEDTSKNLQNEKDQKALLLAKIETLTAELHNAKMDLTHNDRTLGSTDSSHSEMERLQNELQDEVAAKQVMEEKMAELKMEVDKLKSENNVQWSKRELLETENVSILRENKKLYSQVCELKEQLLKFNRISENYSSVSKNGRLDSNYYPSKNSSVGSQGGSSNGSIDTNIVQTDAKTNTSEDDDVTSEDRNDMC